MHSFHAKKSSYHQGLLSECRFLVRLPHYAIAGAIHRLRISTDLRSSADVSPPKHGRDANILADVVKALLDRLNRNYEAFTPITMALPEEGVLSQITALYR